MARRGRSAIMPRKARNKPPSVRTGSVQKKAATRSPPTQKRSIKQKWETSDSDTEDEIQEHPSKSKVEAPIMTSESDLDGQSLLGRRRGRHPRSPKKPENKKEKADSKVGKSPTKASLSSPTSSSSSSSSNSSNNTLPKPRERNRKNLVEIPSVTSNGSLEIPTKESLKSNSGVLEELREKFQKLTMLRTTAAETLLEEYKVTSEARIKAAERIIETLKQENETLRASITETVKAGRLSDASALSESSAFGGVAVGGGGGILKSLVELYSNLSGLEMVADGETENLFHCIIRGRQEFSFDLFLDEEEAQYRYKPTFSPNAPISTRLPAYLQEEIVFGYDQLQLFFWRALNFLMTTSTTSK